MKTRGPSRMEIDDDGHIAILKAVLRGIRVEERPAWVAARLPRTAALLGVSRNWDAISATEEP